MCNREFSITCSTKSGRYVIKVPIGATASVVRNTFSQELFDVSNHKMALFGMKLTDDFIFNEEVASYIEYEGSLLWFIG